MTSRAHLHIHNSVLIICISTIYHCLGFLQYRKLKKQNKKPVGSKLIEKCFASGLLLSMRQRIAYVTTASARSFPYTILYFPCQPSSPTFLEVYKIKNNAGCLQETRNHELFCPEEISRVGKVTQC